MFCTNCGLNVEEGSSFCRACGKSVGPAASPSAIPPPAFPIAAPVAPPLAYAGFWLRFAAYLIDGVILGIPFFILVIVLIFVARAFRPIPSRGIEVAFPATAYGVSMFAGFTILMFLAAMLFILVLQWLYFAGMESSARQGTFGKAAMSLRVTDKEGLPLSFKHATGRYFAKLITGLVPLGIGYIMAGFTEKKQALHDMIAGTLVLRK